MVGTDRDTMSAMRILIIEDNAQREKLLRSWIPPDARVVIAKSAGRAIGILERDRGRVYSGIVLDHDLQEKPATEADRYLSGQDLVDRIISNVSRDVPILVHSVNASQGWVMAVRLQKQGFEVTHIPMSLLTAGVFEEWVQEVREACGANE